MRKAPPIVRELNACALRSACRDDDAWWREFRRVAGDETCAADALFERARSSVTPTYLQSDGLFRTARARLEHELREQVEPHALSVAFAPRGDGGCVLTVSLRPEHPPSEKAMALLQGALLAVTHHVARDGAERERTDRSCTVDVGGPRQSFVERLVACGLDDDAFALGLDPFKLGELVDQGATRGARDGKPLTMRALETSFELTPMQARVALRLAEGASLQEAASSLRMTYGTARVHVKRIFAKLDVRTQAALVAKLLGRHP